MSRLIDLTGLQFGSLTVIAKAESKNKNSAWLCKCKCGKTVIVQAPNLKMGKTKSCGCGVISATIKRSTKHGGADTKLYKVWTSMKARCGNPHDKEYDRYGGRGITVCAEWLHDFGAFQQWAMANGYREGLTIDRINNDGGYEPANCRWISRSEQNKNRSHRRWAKRPVEEGA